MITLIMNFINCAFPPPCKSNFTKTIFPSPETFQVMPQGHATDKVILQLQTEKNWVSTD